MKYVLYIIFILLCVWIIYLVDINIERSSSYEPLLILMRTIHNVFNLIVVSPSVRSDVTPSVTRAGIASGLIQKAIQDMTTIRAEGIYV